MSEQPLHLCVGKSMKQPHHDHRAYRWPAGVNSRAVDGTRSHLTCNQPWLGRWQTDLHKITEHAPMIILEIISIKRKATYVTGHFAIGLKKTTCVVGLPGISFIVGILENLYQIDA